MWSIGFAGAEPAKPMNAFGLLQKARELGVKVVQYGPNLPLDRLSQSELVALSSQAEEWGISIEIGTQGLAPGPLQEQVKLAKKIGCRLLRTTTEGSDGITPPPDEMRKYIAGILPVLEENHVVLAVENGLVPARTLAELVGSVHSPHVGVTLDTVNSLAIPEGTGEVVDALVPHVRSVHVKDFAVERLWSRMGFSVQGRPAGSGKLNVPELLHRLASASPSPNAILELWPPEQGSLEETIQLESAWAVESISYLRHYIAN
jgi:sugar phosphate isomerase/epimerase